MSHPAELPDLFLDRSLGSIHVPNALRAAGLRLTTLAERYGSEHAQFVRDTEWLDEAGRRGEAVLMKDSRIYVNPLERAVVHQAGVRCFCLSKKNGLFAIRGGNVHAGSRRTIVRFVQYVVGTMRKPTVHRAPNTTPSVAESAEPFSFGRRGMGACGGLLGGGSP